MYYWTTNRDFKVETSLLQFLSNLSHSFTGLVAFYNCCLKGGLLKDIIKSNEGASLTICWQALSIIVHEAALRCIWRGTSFSPVIVVRLDSPCDDNVVLAVNSKES